MCHEQFSESQQGRQQRGNHHQRDSHNTNGLLASIAAVISLSMEKIEGLEIICEFKGYYPEYNLEQGTMHNTKEATR